MRTIPTIFDNVRDSACGNYRIQKMKAGHFEIHRQLRDQTGFLTWLSVGLFLANSYILALRACLMRDSPLTRC